MPKNKTVVIPKSWTKDKLQTLEKFALLPVSNLANMFNISFTEFRKHIAKAIEGDAAALKDLSRITGRGVTDLKNAFVKRETFLDNTRSVAAKESFPPERKLPPE